MVNRLVSLPVDLLFPEAFRGEGNEGLAFLCRREVEGRDGRPAREPTVMTDPFADLATWP